MSYRPTIILTGRSGASFTFWIFPSDWQGSNEPGNYVFAKPSPLDRWEIVYIGQTEDFNRRIAEHNQNHLFTEYGITHIFAHVSNDATARYLEEQDLIATFDPPANRSSVKGQSGGRL